MKQLGPTLFISYAHEDHENPLLKRLTDDLIMHGRVSFHLNPQKTDTRETAAQSIDKFGIATSDYFLYIVSKKVADPTWSSREIHLAYASQFRARKLKVIPVKVEDVSVPALLRDAAFIDLNGDYEEGFARLLQIIHLHDTPPLARFDLDTPFRDRTVIEVTNEIYSALIAQFATNPESLRTIDPRRFEEIIAELFRGFGYAVELTAKTRDGGRDVVAIKSEAEVATRYLIECKRPSPGKVIGIRPVRELFGVKTHERATKAILATTAFFSRDALLFFENHKWELEPRDYEGIRLWINQYLKKT
jgi:Restriction endonuclease/TIR domain